MRISLVSGLFYCLVSNWLIMSPPNVMATLFTIANALTGGGGGYGGGGYGGGGYAGYGYANYEMVTPKPTLGKMIGDKIDGINNLKSMLFGPLLNLATSLLNKGGGGGGGYGGGGSYAGGGGGSYGATAGAVYGSPAPAPAAPSASYTSGGQGYSYGSSGGYSNTNPVYMGKSGIFSSPQLTDKYRQDVTYADTSSDVVRQIPVKNTMIDSRLENVPLYYQYPADQLEPIGSSYSQTYGSKRSEGGVVPMQQMGTILDTPPKLPVALPSKIDYLGYGNLQKNDETQ